MEQFKKKLSASVGWKRVNITATATAWTLVHTWPSIVGQYDEVFLYLDNTAEAAVIATIEFWGATTPIEVSLAANSAPTLVVPWFILEWAETPLTVKVFAGTTAVVNAGWHIVRNAR